MPNADFDVSKFDPYQDFMHMYSTATKLAKAHGEPGYEIMMRCLRTARKELNALGDGPLIKHRRGHKRKTKAGSPASRSKSKGLKRNKKH